MTNIVQFMQADDRKALEAIHGMLAYVERELRELKAPQPDLTEAVGRALQLSNSILSEAESLKDLSRRH